MMISNLRSSQSMTQRQFATLVGVSQQFVSSLETGKRKLSIKQAKTIAKAFGIDWKQLFE